MQEIGLVVRTQGQLADVRLRQQSACAKCGKCELAHESKELTVSAVNQAGASAGQTVRMEMTHRDVVTAGLIVYGLPLLMLFLGVAVGQTLSSQLGAAMLGILAMAGTYGLIHWRLEPKMKTSQRFQIVITGIVDEREVNN
ncbi:MAG: SoxR reducing system RseC family protein [Bacillota bacterium]